VLSSERRGTWIDYSRGACSGVERPYDGGVLECVPF